MLLKPIIFLGYVQDTNQELYEEIQNAGFILIFREHNPAMLGKKKEMWIQMLFSTL